MNPISIGILGAGQFGQQFAPLFKAHPGVGEVYAVDQDKRRAAAVVERFRLTATKDSFDELINSSVDAVGIFTQRWSHGPLAIEALRKGKHVYSSVPMAVAQDEIEEIIALARSSGLTYMMGETSYYNPAAVFGRKKVATGEFGRLFYAEGDYVHDMDLGFYDAYRYSGGKEWKSTASYPPMMYPTHSLGGVLSVWKKHAVSVSCIGIRDDRDDGVFDRSVSQFDNDISNASALFEMNGGGAMRTNEFRRVGFPSPIRESRFRYFGTHGSFEQSTTGALWQTKEGVEDVSYALATKASTALESDAGLSEISPTLRNAFASGYAQIHDSRRIPEELRALRNGHEGSHHYLVDDFVMAVANRSLPPVNAWEAARYTLPGLVAHESSRRGGERLPILDFGDAPTS